mgnify:CR=1 FL=1
MKRTYNNKKSWNEMYIIIVRVKFRSQLLALKKWLFYKTILSDQTEHVTT